MSPTFRSKEKWSYTTLSKRGRAYILLAMVVLFLYMITPARTPTPLPPMPGTYQYFKETDFHSKSHRFGAVSHCDTRFAPKTQPDDAETRQTLKALLESYMSTVNKLNIDTWLAHGPLIGWYWNRKLLPWDTDIDVHVSGEGIAMMAQSFNMSEYSYSASPGEAARIYLLDINPHYSIVSEKDVANRIDGRWIDTSNGKFIDITAVHHSTRDGSGRLQAGTLFCKDGHRYKEGDVYPLQQSTFEGVAVNVPINSEGLLAQEYGKKVLTNDHFHWHHFNHATKTWEYDGS